MIRNEISGFVKKFENKNVELAITSAKPGWPLGWCRPLLLGLVDASWMPRSTVSISLRRLVLPRSQIGVHSAEELLSVLRQCTNIEHLDLRSNGLNETFAVLFADALKQHAGTGRGALQHLTMRGNDIGKGGALSLAEAGLRCSVRHLDLSANGAGRTRMAEQVARAVAQYQDLTSLDLGASVLDSITVLAHSLGQCTSLTRVKLDHCKLGSAGALDTLAAGLKACLNLRHLNVSYNEIDDAGAERLLRDTVFYYPIAH
eukprot:232062-Rhodomonas_salina.2